MIDTTQTPRLLFGCYPGGVTGDDSGGLASGPPDDPQAIVRALGHLQAGDRPFLVRGYQIYTDSAAERSANPDRIERYLGQGRTLDLVVQYQSRCGDVAGYIDFIRRAIRRYGPHITTLQVTEEANVPGNPTLDGYYPRVREALVEGVMAARDEATRQGLEQLRVGFNTTVLFGPAAEFIGDIAELGGPPFLAAVDYVGLDFFPDVFRPVPFEDLRDTVIGLLEYHRRQCITPAGIGGHIPLHITENGWPTGPDRTSRRQSEVLETVVRAIADSSGEHNIGAYLHFALRDADTANPGLFHQFGLMRDDYTPKPAFELYRSMIAELGR